MIAVIAGHQSAGEVDLAAGHMAMDIDPPRHDDLAGKIEALVDGLARRSRAADAPVADVKIPHLAVPVIGGIEDSPAAEFDDSHALPMAAAIAVRVAPALGRGEGRRAARGKATMPSPRKICPA